jgi:hypothetical protein
MEAHTVSKVGTTGELSLGEQEVKGAIGDAHSGPNSLVDMR